MDLPSSDSRYAPLSNVAEEPCNGGFAFGKWLSTRRRQILGVLAVFIFCFFAVILGFFLFYSSSTDRWMRYSRSLKGGDFDESVPIWRWSEEDFQEQFDHFVATHGKVYTSEEERNKRYNIFKDNLHFIYAENTYGDLGYKLGITQLADLTRAEFEAKYLGCRLRTPENLEPTAVEESEQEEDDNEPLPTSFDWREKNCINPVYDQNKCGSCWAFSASEAIASAYCAKTEELLHLSEQQLIDCSWRFGNSGCDGGREERAFEYASSEGLCTDDDYPYKDADGICHIDCKQIPTLSNHERVRPKVEILKRTLVNRSAVSAGITMGGKDARRIQLYKRGVYRGSCGIGPSGHALLVVGYGVDEVGGEYWSIKNSWGIQWGEAGYMRMSTSTEEGATGYCNILGALNYPIFGN